MWTSLKIFFTVCVVSMIATCYLLLTTTRGLQYDLQWIAQHLPGKLTVKKIEGTIVSGFKLHHFSYKTPTTTISFELIDIKWNPILLLKGKWDIHQLTLEQGHIILTEKNRKTPDRTSSLKAWWNKITLHHLSLKNIYLGEGKSKIELNGDVTNDWNLQWKINKLNLHSWFHDYYGSLDSEGKISGELEKPRLNATIHVKSFIHQEITIDNLTTQADITLEKHHTHSTIELLANHVSYKKYYYKKLAVSTLGNISIENQTLMASIKMQIAKKPLLSATFAFPHYHGFLNPQQKIDGIIAFQSFDLDKLPLSKGPVKNIRGKVDAHFNIQGTTQNPSITGKLELHQGDFLIPSLGIHPHTITLEGVLLENKTMEIKGNFQLTSNKAEIKGFMDFNKSNFPLILYLQGKQLPIVQLAEYKVKASPNLILTLLYPVLKIEGDVAIPYAEIKPKNLSGTTTLPDEVVFAQNKKSINPLSLGVILNINLTLSDNIQVRYDNLQATLSGNIHITKEEPDTPTTAQGELYSLQGRYTAYGQKLFIEHGRIIYTGNLLTNPGLDITAIKTVRRVLTNTSNDFTGLNTPLYAGTETIKVGVNIRGTAEKPIISLFSNPQNLNQADILSYIILGQPQSNTSNTQGAAILTLLTNLNPKSAKINKVTEFLQETLGLTELNIESVQSFNPSSKSVESTTSFIIGKQLTKKLSLHYSIGLFDPVSVLNLRYQINKHWALQSETSTVDNGADLFYVFERD